MDLLEFRGRSYLVVVDYYSRWLEIMFLKNTTALSVIKKLKAIFSTHGLPDCIKSDNGPQLVSRELKSFLNDMEILTVTSSPNFPQSNGMAESAVKVAKKILQQEDSSLALMNYRATPHSATKVSPAEALMNRKIRTQVPLLESNLEPSSALHYKIADNDKISKIKAKHQCDKHHGAITPLSTLSPGNTEIQYT
ncbi:Pol polyprotein [Elysia marginata]|uniref:Pol polyprotein n=1 Tax=Elysia marginata TaxID=1093978 RepID=A0AAV4G2V7_9GAST|nr:Pol polyprotein [Elysia marginata]